MAEGRYIEPYGIIKIQVHDCYTEEDFYHLSRAFSVYARQILIGNLEVVNHYRSEWLQSHHCCHYCGMYKPVNEYGKCSSGYISLVCGSCHLTVKTRQPKWNIIKSYTPYLGPMYGPYQSNEINAMYEWSLSCADVSTAQCIKCDICTCVYSVVEYNFKKKCCISCLGSDVDAIPKDTSDFNIDTKLAIPWFQSMCDDYRRNQNAVQLLKIQNFAEQYNFVIPEDLDMEYNIETLWN